MYTSVPSASTPNHLFSQSATSCGIHDNIVYSDCGGPTHTFPQMTIYDSLRVNGVNFALWMNSTCGTSATAAPCHGIDPNNPDAGSPIPSPDVAMSGVGRHVDRFFSQKLFYESAANGSLPAFSWVMPPMEACDHPCQDVAKGERLLKDVYEALRAGPKWNKTLFFVTYDDAGGYYDHMLSPHEGVPNDDAPCHLNDQCGSRAKFDFRRLGLRTSAMLISPLVAKGAVFQEPKAGPYNTSQFEHTSILASAKTLFNLTGYLTKRDMWAGNFEELLLAEPRTDCPMHLPDAPLPAKPWGPPPSLSNDGERRLDARFEKSDASSAIPQHCGQKEQVCRGPEVVNVKLRRKIRELSLLLGVAPPDTETMTAREAGEWYNRHYYEWLQAGAPIN